MSFCSCCCCSGTNHFFNQTKLTFESSRKVLKFKLALESLQIVLAFVIGQTVIVFKHQPHNWFTDSILQNWEKNNKVKVMIWYECLLSIHWATTTPWRSDCLTPSHHYLELESFIFHRKKVIYIKEKLLFFL